MDGIKLAIVGATGAVGQEMIKVLQERNLPVDKLFCLAHPSEAGQIIKYGREEIKVQPVAEEFFKEADLALFAVSSELSKELAPLAVENRCVVIDNSSAFRLEDEVPLVVPEVNPRDIEGHKGVIANPNCSTIILAVALYPLHKAAHIQRVLVSTYQAVSGAGIAGIEELNRQISDYLEGNVMQPQAFNYAIAFNVIPQIDVLTASDYYNEEMKLVHETRKIMHSPEMRIAATAVRVPVFRSHSESVALETEKRLSAEEARDILLSSPGIVVQDDPQENIYPMPLLAADHDEVYVGRIRQDLSSDHGLLFWVVADQIRKGAATNAVQIAEIVINNNWL